MKIWMEQALVFAATFVSGMYLAYRIDQRKPPESSLSSDLKRYLQSDSHEIPASIEQVFVKAGQFFDELNPGPIRSEWLTRVMADPEMRKLLEKFFSDSGGSSI